MNRWIEQRKLVQSVNKSNPHKSISKEIDWQEERVKQFHDSFYTKESIIDQSESAKIVRSISKKWGIRVEQLYPEHKSAMNYSWAKSLGPRHGVIWIDHDMMYPSYILHELSHIVVECFIDYDLKGKSKIKEPDHGVLFASTLYHFLQEYYKNEDFLLDFIDLGFISNNIHMVPPDTYQKFEKIFKNQSFIRT